MTRSVYPIGPARLAAGLLLLMVPCLLVLALPAAAHATTYCVSVTGNDTTGDGSMAHPYATVQKAVISAGIPGDAVSVGPGTFDGDVMTAQSNVSLFGAGASLTTLHGTGTGPVINCDNMGVGATISGFTITGGSATYGGGIFSGSGSPMIMNDTITGNSASNWGGGIYCGSSSMVIVNDVIEGNTASVGGGIYEAVGGTTVTNDTIVGNTASPNSGGGTYTNGAALTLTNCIVWDNGDDLGSNCSATYSDISAALTGTGNISSNPDFVSAASGNYHLKAGSPCIDKGTSVGAPKTDKDGIHRPQGNGYDMGAYEYHVLRSTTTKLSAPASVAVKTSLKLSGTVSPSAAPGTVTITKTRKVGGAWESAGSKTVSVKKGKFSYSFRPKYKGSWRFVATYSGYPGGKNRTVYTSSTSKIKTVKVK